MRTKVACLELYSGNLEFLMFFSSQLIHKPSFFCTSLFYVEYQHFSLLIWILCLPSGQSCEYPINPYRPFAPTIESLSNLYIHPSLKLPWLLHSCLLADGPTWTTLLYFVSLKNHVLLHLLKRSPLSFLEPHFHMELCRICRTQRKHKSLCVNRKREIVVLSPCVFIYILPLWTWDLNLRR